MIRWLLSIAQWLDKRFPPKVRVTEELFSGLITRNQEHEKKLARVENELSQARARLDVLEKSQSSLKESIVKGDIVAAKSEAERLRDSFILGDFARAPLTPAPDAYK